MAGSFKGLTGAAAAILLLGALPASAQTAAAPPQPMVKDGAFVMRDGEAIYRNVCAACHMPDAKGAVGAGAYPALAANPKLASPAYPLQVVVSGRKGMPAFGRLLDDEQVAAVVGYVRTHFGNRYAGAVTAADAKAVR